jgi:hypothetical protein
MSNDIIKIESLYNKANGYYLTGQYRSAAHFFKECWEAYQNASASPSLGSVQHMGEDAMIKYQEIYRDYLKDDNDFLDSLEFGS